MLATFFLTSVGGLASPAGASTRASTVLASTVSQTPVSWTPNAFAGEQSSSDPGYTAPGCSILYFGAPTDCQSEVYDTAYVNGEVIVVGAFTEVCNPGKLKSVPTPLCEAGTTPVTRDDIFAYFPPNTTANPTTTAVIDPNFTPQIDQGPVYSVVAGPAGSDTVYVAGAFKTITTAENGTITSGGLIQLNVNNVTTPSTPNSDGTVVTASATPTVSAFKGHVNSGGVVHDLVLSPDGTALYLGGQFTDVDSISGSKFTDGTAIDGLARLATGGTAPGSLDESFPFSISGNVNPRHQRVRRPPRRLRSRSSR